MFHHYFFSLDPDEKVLKANITKALYLADGSAKKQYDNLKESGYYMNVISANISQTISIDSIQVDVNQSPYYFKCYASELLVRSTSTVTRSLITEGYLRNVSRSDNNPHGFLIERWATLLNKDIKLSNGQYIKFLTHLRNIGDDDNDESVDEDGKKGLSLSETEYE